MRHGKKFNHLGRTSTHRKAMLSNMAASLILHKRINTTLAKAKALRTYVEPLITKSKNDTTHSRRTVFAYISDKFAVSELFRDVSVKIADRPGGYTRIIKTGNRLGDNAEMAMIELVDYNEVYVKETKVAKGGAKKSRRGGAKKKVETTAATVAIASPVVEVQETVEVQNIEVAAPIEETITETVVETQVETIAEVPTVEAATEVVAEEEVTPEVVNESPVAETSAEETSEENKEGESEEEKKD
jgi:large subunit ribosomal protein L17